MPAPPVYRPSPSLQRMPAPLAYRPNVGQTNVGQHNVGQVGSVPSAFRQVIQSKPIAPINGSPQARVQVAHVINPSVAKRAPVQSPLPYRPAPQAAIAQPKFSPTPNRIAPAGTSIQRYKVLPQEKVLRTGPAKRPWGGYPYAVVGNAPFSAQTIGRRVRGPHEFLSQRGGAVSRDTPLVSRPTLRVSNNNDMAIEDSNLYNRQPKAFYATQAVITASNRKLTTAGSRLQLQSHPETITICTGWWSQNILNRVTPQYNGGNADLLPQNCNAVGAQVVGIDSGRMTGIGTGKATEVAVKLAPIGHAAYKVAYNAPGDFDEAANLNRIAKEYVESATTQDLQRHGANQFARPKVGEAYTIATVGGGERLPGGKQRVRDFASGRKRDLGWSFHFAGVVAHSGEDRVTLENYARGDGREDNADPRWYFQMYGEASGQSFHEFHEAREDYANPITVAVNSQTTSLPIQRL